MPSHPTMLWVVLAMLVAWPRIQASERIEINKLVSAGLANITASDYRYGPANNLFDDSTGTIFQTREVNPLVVTVTFTKPQPVSESVMIFSGGDHTWSIETADNVTDLDTKQGTYKGVVTSQTGVQLAWHTNRFTPSSSFKVIRLTLRSHLRNEVMVNDWNLYRPDDWFRITNVRPVGNQQAVIDYNAAMGGWYRLESSTNLLTWTGTAPIKATNIEGRWTTEGLPTQGQAFWRVQRIAPETRPAITKKVLVLNYDPILKSKGGLRLHQYMGWQDPVKATEAYLADLTEASYGYVQWKIVEWRDLDEWTRIQDGFRYTEDTYLACWTGQKPWHVPSMLDYEYTIRSQGLDLLVSSGQVDEVILWGGPYFGYWESTMVGDTAYWCNSSPIVHRGVPNYVIMGFNYERGVGEALHAFGHRFESIMSRVFGSWSSTSTVRHDWDRFTRVTALHGNSPAGCGNIHYPVNGTGDYDYMNKRSVLSTADDWLNYPNLTGKAAMVHRESWGGPDYHRNYLKWWYKRVPHVPGRSSSGYLHNWWAYVVDMNEYPESR